MIFSKIVKRLYRKLQIQLSNQKGFTIFSHCQLWLNSSEILLNMYSSEELADIHFVYGFADGNALAAREEYARRFPNRRCPDASKVVTNKTFLLS